MNNQPKEYWGYFYHKEFEMPAEAVAACSAGGSVDDAVEYWEKQIALNYWTDGEKRLGLLEYGAWDEEELDGMDGTELNQKIIWLVSCDIRDSEDYLY